ncbi:MAG: protein-L-isoaspartate(D-aspartate) O-methyltransferase [Myxococcota bacterium]
MGTDLQRREMVERQLVARGITDEAVLRAMAQVPREAFVRADLADVAYRDTPLPIDEGQTVSQPFIVALMASAAQLRGHERVLEVGTGSGYGAAVLSRLAQHVYTVERLQGLARSAATRLQRLGYRNITVLHGDGTLGDPTHAPYDAIVVTAAAPRVPEALVEQLADGGRLVIPVAPELDAQALRRFTREGERLRSEDLGMVQFVPLVGEHGWRPVDGSWELQPPGTH